MVTSRIFVRVKIGLAEIGLTKYHASEWVMQLNLSQCTKKVTLVAMVPLTPIMKAASKAPHGTMPSPRLEFSTKRYRSRFVIQGTLGTVRIVLHCLYIPSLRFVS
mmetsp:Transcript_19292/g.21864  ORF Transcript_19292/g.21864 Transcript_19292/m.21864 type:complete len:105 (-) Transcript_19292:109-423(-)